MKATRQPLSSCHERRFALLWAEAGGPPLIPQYRFMESRKWRADFAHVASRTLIEIDGAVWGTRYGRRGGHEGHGKIRDCEKMLAAWLLGWSTVRLVPQQITSIIIGRIAACINEKQNPTR
jgi:very-short-patch-repair endonuclease